jgi:hypothetical protein
MVKTIGIVGSGVLIRDQRLAIFDSATGKQLPMLQLIDADGFPASREREK